MSVINPTVALSQHFSALSGSPLSNPWVPTFNETLGYIAASYALMVVLFAIAYAYFSRRLNL
jgi:hypothetical protein